MHVICWRLRLLLSSALVFAYGCAETSQPIPSHERTYVECEAPRPELCTQHYDPVCAQRDTGIRCITTPCDSSEWRRYSNACVACADEAVYGYRAGDCADSESN
ncbi:MAG: hypothetical protein HKN59_09460 [Gammaproteobacteria bacterium]|nr:hypothetical protein [Gammaproteobacteria bacterium]